MVEQCDKLKGNTALLDWIPVEVTYTPPTPPPPVSRAEWPYYMAFAKRAFKFHYNFDQPTADNEVGQLIDEFVQRGLNQTVLEELAAIAKHKGELAKAEP